MKIDGLNAENSTQMYLNKIKDTHREKAASNKTPVRTKNMNMDIWIVGTSNQHFRRGSYSETKFSKN